MADAKSLLTERLEKARADAYEDIDIRDSRGEATGLVVRYQAVSRDDIDELQERGAHEGNISLVIRGCQALLLRDDDGRLVSIDTDDPDGAHVDDSGQLRGTPLTYASERTWELLGVDTARDAVKTLHPAPGRIDVEASVITRLTGYGQDDDARPPDRRSRTTR